MKISCIVEKVGRHAGKIWADCMAVHRREIGRARLREDQVNVDDRRTAFRGDDMLPVVREVLS